jgi:drug/metabolite transporter (DMT)-like permease
MWVLLALAAALFQVLRNTAMKRLGHALDEYINVWGRFTFLLPFALALALIKGIPPIKPGFVWTCLAFGLCQNLATLALSKALKLAAFSLVTALWKVSLLLLLVMGYLTLNETPTPLGVTGVLLSTVGVYVLNVSRARISPWEPLRVLFTDAGLRYTLLAAFFYAPSVLTLKQAILLSDAYTGSFGGYAAASLMVTPLVLLTSRQHFGQVHRHWKDFVALGLFAALTTVSQGIAYTLTLSSYVEELDRVSV